MPPPVNMGMGCYSVGNILPTSTYTHSLHLVSSHSKVLSQKNLLLACFKLASTPLSWYYLSPISQIRNIKAQRGLTVSQIKLSSSSKLPNSETIFFFPFVIFLLLSI